MIEMLIEPVSTYASEIDFLFVLVTIIVMPWFFAAEGVFFYFLWRYREQPGEKALYVTGNEPELKRWINWPHAAIIALDLIIIAGAVNVWMQVKQNLPDTTNVVRVTAQQWAWTFKHQGPDGELDTEDDIDVGDELHIVVNEPYHFQLESRDVLHSFSIPVFRLKQDAIPGRRITGWFEATKTGTYDIQCTEMCGIGHGLMPARLIVHTPQEYEAWMLQAETVASR
ncbi:MAG: cytochrome C oxidase subunit II [Myxococcota bacterium]